MTIAEELRKVAQEVRYKSYPLKDLIPLLQRAADALDPKSEQSE